MTKRRHSKELSFALILTAAACGQTWAASIGDVLVGKAYQRVPLTVTAQVEGKGDVNLFYRMAGQTDYRVMGMNKGKGANTYTATIPGPRLVLGTLEYYITAGDGKKEMMASAPVGGSQTPFKVVVGTDATVPKVALLNPKNKAKLPVDKVVAIVGLQDDAGNVDASAVKITWDGKDITKQCNVTGTLVSVVMTETVSEGWHTLKVSAADTAGNKAKDMSWKFWTQKMEKARLSTVKKLGYDGTYDSTTQTEEFLDNVFGAEFGLKYGNFGASVVMRTDDPVFTKKAGQPTNKLRLEYQNPVGHIKLIDTKAQFSLLTFDGLDIRGGSVLGGLGPFRLGAIYGVNKAYVPVDGEDTTDASYKRVAAGITSGAEVKLFGQKMGSNFNLGYVGDYPDKDIAAAKKAKATAAMGTSAFFETKKEGLLSVNADLALSVSTEGYTKNLKPGLPIPIPDVMESLGKLDSAGIVVGQSKLGPLSLKGTVKKVGMNYEFLGNSVAPDSEGYIVEGGLNLFKGGIGLSAKHENTNNNVAGPINVPGLVNGIVAKLPGLSESTKNQVDTLLGGEAVKLEPGDVTVKDEFGLSLGFAALPKTDVKYLTQSVTNDRADAKRNVKDTGAELSFGPLTFGVKKDKNEKTELTFAGKYNQSVDAVDATNSEVDVEGSVKARVSRGKLEYTAIGSFTQTDKADVGAVVGPATRKPEVELGVTMKPFKPLTMGLSTKATMQSATDNSLKDFKVALRAKASLDIFKGLSASVGAEQVFYKNSLDPKQDFSQLKAGIGVKGEW